MIVFLQKIVSVTFEFIYIALLVRVILSWVPHNPDQKFIQWIYKFTDPILDPFKNIIPSHRIGIDLSPLFAFLVLGFIKRLLLQLLS